MALPRTIYLRQPSGEAIGPVPLRDVEVLYDSRVVDERTPVSVDGGPWSTIGDEDNLIARLREVKTLAAAGHDPWADDSGAPTPAPVPSTSDTVVPLRAMFDCAVAKSTGVLSVHRKDGAVRLSYSDGKVVAVDSDIPALAIGEFLVKQRVCDASAIKNAAQRAPQMGGDLGAALISMGLIPPHTYVERYVEWARTLVGAAVSARGENCGFEPAEVRAPAVPLGLHRFGVLMDGIRSGFTKDQLEDRLAEQRNLILIPASFEGASIDDMNLDARELRAFKLIDGTKSAEALLGSVQGRGEPGLRVVFLTTQLGMVVFGDDPEKPKELDEAKRLQDLAARMKSQSYYEQLGIKQGATDEQVRAAYMSLAKKYHPDGVKQSAAPALIEIRNTLFALVQEAVNNVDTADKRRAYDGLLAHGVTSKEGEQLLVQAMLEAEALFTKGEAQARSRRYDDAVQSIEQAIKLKPDDVEFKIHRVYYHFLTKKNDRDAAASTAVRDIKALLKEADNIASAYLFLGRLNKVLNEVDAAAKAFKKVLEFDPNNAEATSELRLVAMRKDKKKKWL